MLKLTAFDADDLRSFPPRCRMPVRLADMGYLAKPRQFALVANRFAWEQQPQVRRRRTGLHFDHVLGVKQQGIRGRTKDAVLSLLAITFEPGR